MAIERVKIRARITIGSLVVETPYIQSFNVNVARGQISTFSAQLKVLAAEIVDKITGSGIIIQAGENSPSKTIFSGVVKRAKITPVFDDPSFILMSLDGQDVLSYLSGKKYTRRCRATAATWVSLDNVLRPGLRTGKFRAQGSMSTTIVPVDGLMNNQNPVTTTPSTILDRAASNMSTTGDVMTMSQIVTILNYDPD